MSPTLIVLASIALGVLLGYALRHLVARSKKGSIELEIAELELRAREEAQAMKARAQATADDIERKASQILLDAKDEERRVTQDLKKTEERLVKKEEILDTRQVDLDREIAYVKEKAEEVKQIKERLEEQKKNVEIELEKAANLSQKEALELLFASVENRHAEDLLVRMNKLEREGVERLDRRAKEILTSSIHRLGNGNVNEILTTTVEIPNEDIKGKIIGKEGRNIRVFERLSGVELLVDENPGVIVISGFDPLRRQIAKVALENLIADGRIQPVKIEECIEKAKSDLENIVKKKGEDAIFETGLLSVDPRLVLILGRLHFRTSYGQNVLQHSIEMAHIAGMMASELGADTYVAKAGALFHDIGKAVDHEIQGTHVEIGRKILAKYGVDERVIQAMQAHHEEYPYETLESVIVQVADAVSGGRPGARRDSTENYLKRLSELEAIANSFAGITRSYALQAGRELRIFVTPDQVTELDARNIARNIALRVENELRYPGEIKIHVIRETRVIEIAR